MAGEDHLGVGKELQRAVDVAAPLQRVAHLGAAQRVEVVHRVRDDLGAAEGALRRQVEGHLGGRLGVGRVLEDERHAVDGHRLRRVVDQIRRHREAERAGGRLLAEAGVDVAARTARQPEAVHVLRPPPHGDAGEDVLAGRLLDEAARRDDADLRAGRRILGEHAPHAGEVVDVAVGEDHRHHRRGVEMLARQRERGAGGLDAGQRIHDDPAGLAADHRHVGEVVAAHLVDAVGDLEEPVDVVERRLPPEAGIGARRRFPCSKA